MGPLIALALVGALAGQIVTPSGVELERLADSSYYPPNLPSGAFIIDNPPPFVCGESLLFEGLVALDSNPSVGFAGLYEASPRGVEVFANYGTPVPGSNRTFENIKTAFCPPGYVAFLGDDNISPLSSGRSVFIRRNGVFETALPSDEFFGTKRVRNYSNLSASAEEIAATASLVEPFFPTSIGLVVKPLDGPAELIAATHSTILPGQAVLPFGLSDTLWIDRDLIFRSAADTIGIYRWNRENGFEELVNSQTVYPAVGSTIAFLSWYSNLDYGLVFMGFIPTGFGLFVYRDGQVDKLVVPGDLTEDGETLDEIKYPSGAGSLLTFTASTLERPVDAVFVRTPEGVIRRILGGLDVIDGRTMGVVKSTADHRYVGIWTQENNNPSDIVLYRASFERVIDVPAASGVGLLGFAVLLSLVGLIFLARRVS